MSPEELITKIRESKNLQIEAPELSLNGSEFARIIDQQSISISRAGLQPGNRIIFPLSRSAIQVATLLAALRNGLLVFIVNPSFNTDRLLELSQFINPHALFLDCALASILQRKSQHLFKKFENQNFSFVKVCNVPQIQDNLERSANIALLSSGTTNEPKIILHKFENLLLNAKLHAEAIGLLTSDSVAITLPLHYSYGLVAVLFSGLFIGCKLFFESSGNLYSIKWFKENNISVLSTVPSGIIRMLNKALPPLRILTVGGDVTSVNLAYKILNYSPKTTLYTTYGLTEAGPRVSTYKVDLDCLKHLDSLPLGTPLPGVSWRLETQDSNSQEGELIVKTSTMMLGYYRQEKLFKESVLDINSGELKTRDFVRKTGQDMFFLGRSKQIISRGGEKIYPIELENRIKKFDGIVDVWVKGIYHNELGEVPQAFIVVEKGFVLNSLLRYLRQYLPRTHIPEIFKLVQELPQEAALYRKNTP